MPALFEQSGLRFEYPENWTLETDELLEGGLEVTVTSPSGAFWSVSVHSSEGNMRSLLDTVLASMKEEFSDLDAEWAGEFAVERELRGYNVNFYCLDLTNTARIRGFQDRSATYLLIFQAEDHDFEALEPVFMAMTVSLLRSLAG